MSDVQTTNANATTSTKKVALYSRVQAAVLDTVTGEVELADGVDPRHLVQDLVREIQVLQQQVQQLKGAQTDATEKL